MTDFIVASQAIQHHMLIFTSLCNFQDHFQVLERMLLCPYFSSEGIMLVEKGL
jgi:hypothetical protein